MSLWCNSCDCDYAGILCKHILFLRLYYLLQLRRAASWWDAEERLYAVLDRERVLSPSAEAAAPAAPSDASPRTPASELVLEADSVLAELAHLTAAAAEDLAGGDEQARSKLDSMLKSARAAVALLRKGLGTGGDAASGSRSARKFTAIARDPRVIAAPRPPPPSLSASCRPTKRSRAP